VPPLTSTVGRYELLRELGRGGMATVYLARQTELDRLVALKELAALQRADPSFAQRFLREARLAGSVSHPNVITVYDLFENDGTPYIAMEYAGRGSLRPYLGRLSLSQLGGVVEAVLAGLAAAEKREIVHRDLKPENLLVADDGRVKISDFGIAKATNRLQGETSLTVDGATIGTPNYMAPEQALAQEVGPWTDLYSLGIIAFECVIGVTPFGDTEEPMAIVMRQVNEPVPPVNELDPGLDPRLARWIDWLVEKEPERRPQSADEAWRELDGVLVALLGPQWREGSQLPVLAEAAPTIPGPLTPPPPSAPKGPLTEAHLGALGGIPTVPPSRPPDQPAPPAEHPPRRGRGWRKLVLAVVAVVALAAGVASRTGGSSQAPPAASSSGSSSTTPSDPASSPGSGAAGGAPPGVSQIQQQSPQGRSMAQQAVTSRQLAQRYDTAAAQAAQLPSARVKNGPAAHLVTALRQTAAAYRTAGAAADQGDQAGYAAALLKVDAAKQNVDRALVEMGATPPQPTGSSGSSSQPAGPCSGDSSSDDPSDDSCNP
jgi:serine/threonine protein kinase